MKKTIIALSLSLLLNLAAPVMANPFSDLPADHWSYDAVDKLVEDDIVAGNPDGTFSGHKSITRYEMATIVAKAMATAESNADKISSEDKANIDKLAIEFQTELNNLGVKMDALDKKIGNLKFTGDVRIRHLNDDKDTTILGATTTNKVNNNQIRFRLTVNAKINNKITALARLRVDNYLLNQSNLTNPNVDADQFYVQYADKNKIAKVGRFETSLGQGTIFNKDKLKGVMLTKNLGKANATVMQTYVDSKDAKVGSATENDKITLTAWQLENIKLGKKITTGLDYVLLKDKDTANAFSKKAGDTQDEAKIYGLNTKYDFNKKLSLGLEYIKSDMKLNGTDDNQDALLITLKKKQLTPKADLTLSYAQIGANAIIPKFYIFDDVYNGTIGAAGIANTKETKLWDVKVDYSLLRNTNLYIEYTQGKTEKLLAAVKEGKYTRLESGLELKF